MKSKLSKPLDAQEIARHLTTPAKVIVLAEVDSTSQYLKKNTQENHPAICIAETQTHGKGRRGNEWISKGHNITFSTRWQFPAKQNNLSSLGIISSIICARALSDLGYPNIMVKWPNDLIVNNKKLGGILVEHFQTGSQSTVIIGIGINAICADDSNIDQAWADLQQLTSEHLADRNTIITTISNTLLHTLENYNTQNILQENWTALDWINNQAVWIYSGNKKTQGIARGIQHDGALRIETNQGLQHFYSGDVSLRKQDNI